MCPAEAPLTSRCRMPPFEPGWVIFPMPHRVSGGQATAELPARAGVITGIPNLPVETVARLYPGAIKDGIRMRRVRSHRPRTRLHANLIRDNRIPLEHPTRPESTTDPQPTADYLLALDLSARIPRPPATMSMMAAASISHREPTNGIWPTVGTAQGWGARAISRRPIGSRTTHLSRSSDLTMSARPRNSRARKLITVTRRTTPLNSSRASATCSRRMVIRSTWNMCCRSCDKLSRVSTAVFASSSRMSRTAGDCVSKPASTTQMAIGLDTPTGPIITMRGISLPSTIPSGFKMISEAEGLLLNSMNACLIGMRSPAVQM